MSCYSAFCRKVNGRTISAPNSRIMPIMSGGGIGVAALYQGYAGCRRFLLYRLPGRH